MGDRAHQEVIKRDRPLVCGELAREYDASAVAIEVFLQIQR